ncbi:polysaccharide lyase, partial [Arsukibacterium sp.]|uniref:polysaccharide lyase n=1 Tax=Arsukibacterium sp. TaxID=1977258 RepID=UPI002FDB8352
MLKINWLLSALLCSVGVLAQSQPVLWHEGTKDIRGATNRYSYHQAYIEWQTPMGDWFDKNGHYLGDAPYSLLQVDAKADNWLIWDLNTLIPHISTTAQLDLLLRLQPNSSGHLMVASKEQGYQVAPSLVLEFNDKKRMRINAVMDTYLDTSTYRHLGGRNTLRVSEKNPLLLAFDLSQIDRAKLSAVKLELHRQRQSGTPAIGVFLLRQPTMEDPVYPAQLAEHSIFNEQFTRSNWMTDWQDLAPRSNIERVQAPAHSSASHALKVSFSTRQNLALSMSLFTQKLLGAEPDSLFFEYDLYLAKNWLQGEGGGKFPGFAGTYGRAGWGGRKADGTNGWSARGQFLSAISSDDQLKGLTPLGSYLYLNGSNQSHGEVHPWRQHSSKLTRERWYKISQQLTLNTPGKNDGELQVWVDEKLVLHRSDLNFRTVPELKIERLWFNFYHG